MTIVLFIAVLVFLILVHELGHFLAAKWAKMRVDEFAIGFPPRIASWKKGETEYSLNLLPIGGYVKIFGENGEDEVSERDRAHAFGARPRYHQAVVLIAGVAMNVLAAWLIFFAVAMIGTPTLVDESEAGENSSLTIISVLENSPAAEANIPIGAKLISARVGDEVINKPSPTEFTEFISSNQDSSIEIVYQHKGEEFIVNLETQAGVIEAEPERKAIGISTAFVETVRQNPLEALISSTERTWYSLYTITVGIVTFFGSAFTFSADLTQVAGPVGIAGLVGEAAEFGIVPLLVFTAFISLNLAVINLLPIPALDGGRLVFVAIEAIIRRPINPEWVGRINLIGFSLLILLMILVTYSDIVKLF